jgi:hypothetical protein
MELIWWITLWCLFVHHPVNDKSDPDSQSRAANLVFPQYQLTTKHCYLIFTVAAMWQCDIVTTLPAEFATAAHHLELLNSALRSTYCTTYQNFMNEETRFISSIAKLTNNFLSVLWVTIHQAFQDKLWDVRDAVHHCEITYLPSNAPVQKHKGNVTDQTVGKEFRQVSTTTKRAG